MAHNLQELAQAAAEKATTSWHELAQIVLDAMRAEKELMAAVLRSYLVFENLDDIYAEYARKLGKESLSTREKQAALLEFVLGDDLVEAPEG